MLHVYIFYPLHQNLKEFQNDTPRLSAEYVDPRDDDDSARREAADELDPGVATFSFPSLIACFASRT